MPHTIDATPMGRFTRKIQRQPRLSTRKPPSGGPTLSPRYTTITLMPSALPRSVRGNTEVTMAAAVALSRAAPQPCTTRLAMSQAPFMLTAANKEPAVNRTSPPR
jgi:hypothetical protein